MFVFTKILRNVILLFVLTNNFAFGMQPTNTSAPFECLKELVKIFKDSNNDNYNEQIFEKAFGSIENFQKYAELWAIAYFDYDEYCHDIPTQSEALQLNEWAHEQITKFNQLMSDIKNSPNTGNTDTCRPTKEQIEHCKLMAQFLTFYPSCICAKDDYKLRMNLRILQIQYHILSSCEFGVSQQELNNAYAETAQSFENFKTTLQQTDIGRKAYEHWVDFHTMPSREEYDKKWGTHSNNIPSALIVAEGAFAIIGAAGAGCYGVIKYIKNRKNDKKADDCAESKSSEQIILPEINNPNIASVN
jgi:cell fate (sporulation/competence/biofilm development) regulator YlbF (YheA/YmcA/DUF963 family)